MERTSKYRSKTKHIHILNTNMDGIRKRIVDGSLKK
jgi:hypothetical protein